MPGSPGAVVVCIERNDLCAMEWNALGVSIPPAPLAVPRTCRPSRQAASRITAGVALSDLRVPCVCSRNSHRRNLRSNATRDCWVLRCMQWAAHTRNDAEAHPESACGRCRHRRASRRRLSPGHAVVSAGCPSPTGGKGERASIADERTMRHRPPECTWRFGVSAVSVRPRFRAAARSAAHARRSSGTAPLHPRYRRARAGSCGNDRHWRGSGATVLLEPLLGVGVQHFRPDVGVIACRVTAHDVAEYGVS